MKLDKKLNLVIPLDYADVTYYVHSVPISREVFENYYMVIAKVFSQIHMENLSAVAGPRVAYLMLKSTAMEQGVWDGEAGVANGLMAEIVRLSNVIMPKDGAGWKTMPLHDVLQQKLLDEDDVSEVMNALAFFTVGSCMYPRRDQQNIQTIVSRMWGGLSVPSNCTEYAASLPTSTETASSGATAVAS